jgi:hypothetical protein
MSAHESHEAQEFDVVFDAKREWAIYRCTHGCHHVLLDRVSLTLNDEEFRALQELMSRASHRVVNSQESERMH